MHVRKCVIVQVKIVVPDPEFLTTNYLLADASTCCIFGLMSSSTNETIFPMKTADWNISYQSIFAKSHPFKVVRCVNGVIANLFRFLWRSLACPSVSSRANLFRRQAGWAKTTLKSFSLSYTYTFDVNWLILSWKRCHFRTRKTLCL